MRGCGQGHGEAAGAPAQKKLSQLTSFCPSLERAVREGFSGDITSKCGRRLVCSLAFWASFLPVGAHFPSHSVWLHNSLWPMKRERNYVRYRGAEALRASVCSTTVGSTGHSVRAHGTSISSAPGVPVMIGVRQAAGAGTKFLSCKQWRMGLLVTAA